jgi:outer membrane protein assembly factor BamB
VVGVTNFGDVVVLDRASGASKAAPFRLPGLVAARSESHRMPASLFGDGLLDPRLRDWAWQLIFGGSMRSANTPAVASSGRIFVAATSERPGLGALYGLDLAPGADGRLAVRVAFAAEMGPGSGSSPTLSPDERQVYVSDESGLVYAFDTLSGARRWTAPTTATAAAFAIGDDGMLVALTVEPALTALDAEGRTVWHSDLSALVAAEGLPDLLGLGAPVAIGSGNPTLVAGEVLVPVLFGYRPGLAGFRLTVPVRAALVAVDARTGRGIRRVVALRDDSAGITAVLPDGTLMVSLGAATTSAVRGLHAPMRWLLPDGLEPLAPVGGLQVFRPLP